MCTIQNGEVRLGRGDMVKISVVAAVLATALSLGGQWALLKQHTENTQIHQTAQEKAEARKADLEVERQWLTRYVDQVADRLAQQIAFHLSLESHKGADEQLENHESRIVTLETLQKMTR